MQEFDALVELLTDVLGDPKRVNEYQGQIAFDCPNCDIDRHKGNFEVSIIKNAYHCWSCGDSDGTHGSLGKLFDVYGNKKQKKIYLILRPEDIEIKKKVEPKLVLPEGYIEFKDSNPIYPPHREALNYLKERGITDEIISKYRIGYTMKGEYSGRIIVPSYNDKGVLNYFIGRSWDKKNRFKYKNPEASKDIIIFNEHLINWNEDVYIVEGIFDAFFLPNSIPILGKHLSDNLFSTIYSRAKSNVIICLDGDAFKNSVKLYRELNGGNLHGRIKVIKLPVDKDVCDVRGDIGDFFVKIR